MRPATTLLTIALASGLALAASTAWAGNPGGLKRSLSTKSLGSAKMRTSGGQSSSPTVMKTSPLSSASKLQSTRQLSGGANSNLKTAVVNRGQFNNTLKKNTLPVTGGASNLGNKTRLPGKIVNPVVVAPRNPVAPIGPIGPIGPVKPPFNPPIGPIGPKPPVGPIGPIGPVKPPVGPIGPIGPIGPVKPPVGPIGPIGPVKPPVGPIGPIGPVKPPVGPIGPIGPVKPPVAPPVQPPVDPPYCPPADPPYCPPKDHGHCPPFCPPGFGIVIGCPPAYCGPGYSGTIVVSRPVIVEQTVVVEEPRIEVVEAEAKLPEIPAGATATLYGEKFGLDAGRVVLQIDGLALPVTLVKWEDGQAVVTLPELAVLSPMKAQLHVLRADDTVAQSFNFLLIADEPKVAEAQ